MTDDGKICGDLSSGLVCGGKIFVCHGMGLLNFVTN